MFYVNNLFFYFDKLDIRYGNCIGRKCSSSRFKYLSVISSVRQIIPSLIRSKYEPNDTLRDRFKCWVFYKKNN